ncbi:MAG: P1 family peptidase, partial [Actinomycetota bacterium]
MITRIPGIRVGHTTDAEGLTGCTVVLCPAGTVGSGEVRGGAPGTRETDLLRPGMLVEEVHAILLTGGSAFGLAAADGVMRYLEEQGVGFDAEVARVPIVP